MRMYIRVVLLVAMLSTGLAFQPYPARSQPLIDDSPPVHPTPAAPADDLHWVYLPLVVQPPRFSMVSQLISVRIWSRRWSIRLVLRTFTAVITIL